MFDAHAIALEVIPAVQRHLAEVLGQLYFMPPDIDPVAPLVNSPLRQRIALLVAVANGESQHEGEVREALLQVSLLLDRLPPQPALQEVVDHVQLWLERDELITLSEAATILRGTADNRDLVAINGYIERGRLSVLRDPNEPNPTKARRVRRSEVEKLREG